MSEGTGPWGDELEVVWKQFRAEVVEGLEGALVGSAYCIDVLPTEEEGDVPPYLQAIQGPVGVRAEVSSNHYLTPPHLLNEEQEALLADIGWLRPEPETTYNHHAVGDEDDLEWLAVMMVRTLREVFGVVHPALIEVTRVDEPPAGPAYAEGVAGLHPSDRDELVAMVDEVMATRLADDLFKDGDGDIPILTGDSMVYIQVAPEQPAVDVFAIAVVDVADAVRALTEVNILNSRSELLTWVLRDDRIVVRRRVGGSPFVPEQLLEAVAVAVDTVDEAAGDLVQRVGGRKFCVEPPEPEPLRYPRRPRPSRTPFRTLVQLEEDQPGSVDPHLAAHLFKHDQRDLLEQISRLRRSGRDELVPLLRAALRVVVEAEAQQGAHQ